MLVSNARHHPNPKKVPADYKLGEGHINFFKNKLKYLKERHETIKKEMQKRGFQTNKTLNLKNIDETQLKNWKPKDIHLKIIKKRLIEKINKKPKWYRYYGKKINKKEMITKIKNAN